MTRMAARSPVGNYAVEADTATETVTGLVERVIGALHASSGELSIEHGADFQAYLDLAS